MTPPRASPLIEMRSRPATTLRGCGPSRRRSTSHCGGVRCSSVSSSRVIIRFWKSSGVAGRYTSSLAAAVDAFISWDFFAGVTRQG